MNQLLDFLSILLFFICYKIWGIFPATALLMLCITLQVAYQYFHQHHIAKTTLVTFVIIICLGSITLLSRNELFIKLKPTLVFSSFAVMLALGKLIWQHNFIATMLAPAKIILKQRQWDQLLWSWVIFFLAMSVTNFLVMHYCSTNTWVNFKLFGSFGALILFCIGQSLWIAQCSNKN